MASINAEYETLQDIQARPARDLSGWCDGCGRRRGRDGRCPNCDPWWSNALIQVGGPLILGTMLLLVLGVRMLDPSRRLPASDPPASVFSVSPQTAWAASRSVAALAAVPMAPAAPSPAHFATFSTALPPSQDAIQRVQLERLRSLSRQVDAALMQRQDPQARTLLLPAWVKYRAALDPTFVPTGQEQAAPY